MLLSYYKTPIFYAVISPDKHKLYCTVGEVTALGVCRNTETNQLFYSNWPLPFDTKFYAYCIFKLTSVVNSHKMVVFLGVKDTYLN